MSEAARPLRRDEDTWLRGRVCEDFGLPDVVRNGEWLRLADCEALRLGEGYLAFRDDGVWLEVAMIGARPEGQRIGRRLLAAVCDEALRRQRSGVRVTTTNDNLRALAVYQLAGFRLAELRPNAVARARALKPSIPQQGADGLPIRDEIDLVWKPDETEVARG